MHIQNFSDFCAELQESGFSMGGGSAKGIYAVVPFGWEEGGFPDSPVRWHTGDPETDPWEWRMRVLEERTDIAYAKLFFNASGYITAAWYPYFLAVRRGTESLEQAYARGSIEQTAKRIYDVVVQHDALPLHEIKLLGGFSRDESARFDRAMTQLQSRMFLTMCGRTKKLNKFGVAYGWSSTAFTSVERFWEMRGMELPKVDPEAAYEKIRQQILLLNPDAAPRKIDAFIRG